MSETQRVTDIERNQGDLWSFQSHSPTPQVLKKQAVNDSTWVLMHTVPNGAFVQLQEVLFYNGDAGTVTWRMAITSSTDTDPSGSTIDEPNVFQSGRVLSGESAMLELATGLFQGWKVWFLSTATAGVNFNVCLTGLVITFQ